MLTTLGACCSACEAGLGDLEAPQAPAPKSRLGGVRLSWPIVALGLGVVGGLTYLAFRKPRYRYIPYRLGEKETQEMPAFSMRELVYGKDEL